MIKENNFVMLKVEPRFKLDRTFRGPYHVDNGGPVMCSTAEP